MMTNPNPGVVATADPGDREKASRPEYRLLRKYEKIRVSDELLLDDCQTWAHIHREADKWFIGHQYNRNIHVPMRRKVSDE